MSKWKKCSRCNINYITEDEEYCSECLKELNPAPTTGGGVLGNDELGGERFSNDESGYSRYLVKRKYEYSTTDMYSKALDSIKRIEKMTFGDMMDNVDKLVADYALDGEKKKLGETQHGTWRNALCRLKDFDSYIKNYMK